MKGSLDLLLKFWDPLHISGTVWARNFKFGRQIDCQGTNERNANAIGSKGVVIWSLDLLLKFWDPYLGNSWR